MTLNTVFDIVYFLLKYFLAIVMGTMMLIAGVCWCTYGGWNRDRDLQTGYSASGAAGDSMTRTVREFHQIDRNELCR